MTPTQCRMARIAIKITTAELAELSGITQKTLNGYENGKDAYKSTEAKIEQALLSTGKIRFEGSNGVFLIDEVNNGSN